MKWYQKNSSPFITWDDAENTLRDQFKEFTSGNQLMQEFFQIEQEQISRSRLFMKMLVSNTGTVDEFKISYSIVKDDNDIYPLKKGT